jgi:hypothetical protein
MNTYNVEVEVLVRGILTGVRARSSSEAEDDAADQMDSILTSALETEGFEVQEVEVESTIADVTDSWEPEDAM